jgi:hypothetical protein
MSSLMHKYDTIEASETIFTNYLFFSEGTTRREDVLKIIQFTYIRDFNNRQVFNLGFGDYDINVGEINDVSMTENGDVYKVFNTVLSTIPLFFDKHTNAVILVRGSDGQSDYVHKCKQNCTKKCTEFCHKFNRRMKLYCNYVSRKCSLFQADYQFLGGISNNEKWFDFEMFIPGKLYDGLLLSKKCLNLSYEAE